MRSYLARRLGALSTTALLALSLSVPATASPHDRVDEARERAEALRDGPAAFRAAEDGAVQAADTEFIELAATPDLRHACPSGRVPRNDLRDVGAPFTAAINCLLWYGVTQGRTATTFEQNGTVSRAQMAVFVHRMLDNVVDLPAYDGRSRFPDVDDRGFASAEINVLASSAFTDRFDETIVAGRSDGRFDPSAPVRRDQMASFLARAFRAIANDAGVEPDFTCENIFRDQAQIPAAHRENVELLCGFRIAAGRQDGTYGPADDVTRGQMAAFLMRTFDVFANDDVMITLLPDRNLFVSGATCRAGATGTATDPFCTIQRATSAAAAVTDDYVRIRVRSGGGPGGSYAENVTAAAGAGAVVDIEPQPWDGAIDLRGSLAASAGDEGWLAIIDMDVTRPSGGPAVRVTDSGQDGIVLVIGGVLDGPQALVVEQGEQAFTGVFDVELRGSQRVLDAISAALVFVEDSTFVSDGADAFVVLPEGVGPEPLTGFTDPAAGNTFSPTNPATGTVDGRNALIPVS